MISCYHGVTSLWSQRPPFYIHVSCNCFLHVQVWALHLFNSARAKMVHFDFFLKIKPYILLGKWCYRMSFHFKSVLNFGTKSVFHLHSHRYIIQKVFMQCNAVCDHSHWSLIFLFVISLFATFITHTDTHTYTCTHTCARTRAHKHTQRKWNVHTQSYFWEHVPNSENMYGI